MPKNLFAKIKPASEEMAKKYARANTINIRKDKAKKLDDEIQALSSKKNKDLAWAGLVKNFSLEHKKTIDEVKMYMHKNVLLTELEKDSSNLFAADLKAKQEFEEEQRREAVRKAAEEKAKREKALAHLNTRMALLLEEDYSFEYVNQVKECERLARDFNTEELSSLSNYQAFLTAADNSRKIHAALLFDQDIIEATKLKHDTFFSDEVAHLISKYESDVSLRSYYKEKASYQKLVQDKIGFDNQALISQYESVINQYSNVSILEGFKEGDSKVVANMNANLSSLSFDMNDYIPSFSDNWQKVLNSFANLALLLEEQLERVASLNKDTTFLHEVETISSRIKKENPSLFKKETFNLLNTLENEARYLSLAIKTDERIKAALNLNRDEAFSKEVASINASLADEIKPFIKENEALKKLNYDKVLIDNKDDYDKFASFLEKYNQNTTIAEVSPADSKRLNELKNRLPRLKFNIRDYIPSFDEKWTFVIELFANYSQTLNEDIDRLAKAVRDNNWLIEINALLESIKTVKKTAIDAEHQAKLAEIEKEITLVTKAQEIQERIYALENKERDALFLDEYNAILKELEGPAASYVLDKSKLNTYEKDIIGIKNKEKINLYKKLLSVFESYKEVKEYQIDDIQSFLALDKEIPSLPFDIKDYIDDFADRWQVIKDSFDEWVKYLDGQILILIQERDYDVIPLSEELKRNIDILSAEQKENMSNLEQIDKLDEIVKIANLAKSDDEEMLNLVQATTKKKLWAKAMDEMAISLKNKDEREKAFYLHKHEFDEQLVQAAKIQKSAEIEKLQSLIGQERNFRKLNFLEMFYQDYLNVEKNLIAVYDIPFNEIVPGYDEKWPVIRKAMTDYAKRHHLETIEEKEKKADEPIVTETLEKEKKGSLVFAIIYEVLLLSLCVGGYVVLKIFEFDEYLPLALGLAIAQGATLIGVMFNFRKRKPFVYTLAQLGVFATGIAFYVLEDPLAYGLLGGLFITNIFHFFFKKKLNLRLYEVFTIFAISLPTLLVLGVPYILSFITLPFEFPEIDPLIYLGVGVLLYLIATAMKTDDCYIYFYLINAMMIAGAGVINHFYGSEYIIFIYMLMLSGCLGCLFPIFKKGHRLACLCLSIFEVGIAVIYYFYLNKGLDYLLPYLNYAIIGFGGLYFLIWLMIYLRKPLLNKSYAVGSHIIVSLAAFSTIFVKEMLFYGMGLAASVFILNLIGIFIDKSHSKKTSSITYDDVLVSSSFALATTIILSLSYFFEYDVFFLYYVAGALFVAGVFFFIFKAHLRQLSPNYKYMFTLGICLMLLVPMGFIWLNFDEFYAWASIAFVLLLVFTFGQFNESKMVKVFLFDSLIIAYFAAFYVLKFIEIL